LGFHLLPERTIRHRGAGCDRPPGLRFCGDLDGALLVGRSAAGNHARHARSLGLNLTLHAASYDVNCISTNPGIRRESRRQLRSSLHLAAALGASVVVVHPGQLSSSRGDRSEAWKSLEEIVVMLDDWADEDEVCVGIENMEKKANQILLLPQDLARLFARSWRHVRLTLDLAHTRH